MTSERITKSETNRVAQQNHREFHPAILVRFVYRERSHLT
jgi:hypothetical protein